MSTIFKIRDNLLTVIRNKEELLAEYRKANAESKFSNMAADTVVRTMIKVLEVNLDELYGILTDVQIACKEAVDDSWRMYPDRMGR